MSTMLGCIVDFSHPLKQLCPLLVLNFIPKSVVVVAVVVVL